MASDELHFPPGTRVKVKRDCPHTLPAYAQVKIGAVVSSEGSSVSVRFAEGRVYPVPAEWLEVVDHDPEEE